MGTGKLILLLYFTFIVWNLNGISRGGEGGLLIKNPFHGEGMDILWNYTIENKKYLELTPPNNVTPSLILPAIAPDLHR